jgi:drug/metabolite transporter (DMT)-like permease
MMLACHHYLPLQLAASNAAVLGVLSPAWTMIISLTLRRERFIWLKLIGIVTCVVGATVIINPTQLDFSYVLCLLLLWLWWLVVISDLIVDWKLVPAL